VAWQGFDGRAFLTQAEHQTYLRRPPVRFARRGKSGDGSVCEVCGLPSTEDNPTQVSHLIPFMVGVQVYGFTPDYLDTDANLKWAHRTTCNKSLELSSEEIESLVAQLRVQEDVDGPSETL